MLKLFSKRKKYIVAIITKNGIDYIETIATNKKEAREIVSEVLLKCEIFNFKSKEQFKLKSKRIRSQMCKLRNN